MKTSDYEQLRSIDLKAFDADYKHQRALMARQRFIMGLKEAFDSIPGLPSIRCLFGQRPKGMGGTRTFLQDMKCPDEATCAAAGLDPVALQKSLEKALMPMRRSLGNDTDTYGTLSLFFRHDNVELSRELFEAGLDLLLDPQWAQFRMEDMQAAMMERKTSPAQGVARGPRL